MRKKLFLAFLLSAVFCTFLTGCERMQASSNAMQDVPPFGVAHPIPSRSKSLSFRTPEQVVQQVRDMGYLVTDAPEKPDYRQYGAQDGLTFLIGKSKISIYEYASEKEARAALRRYPVFTGMQQDPSVLYMLQSYSASQREQIQNNLLIETDSLTALQIFKGIPIKHFKTPLGENTSVATVNVIQASVPKGSVGKSAPIEPIDEPLPEAPENRVYVDMVADITNLSDTTVSAGTFLPVHFLYEAWEAYDPLVFCETDTGIQLADGVEILPGQRRRLHYIALLPQNITTMKNGLTAVIQVDDWLSYADLQELFLIK